MPVGNFFGEPLEDTECKGVDSKGVIIGVDVDVDELNEGLKAGGVRVVGGKRLTG